MFNWLRKRIADRRKAVFPYWDGTRIRRIDPMLAMAALKSHKEFDWSRTPKQCDSASDEVSIEGYQLTQDAVCAAFDVKPFDGTSGLTQAECLDLLAAFTGWLGVQKKTPNNLQTSSEPTGTESSNDNSATRSKSDST
jgi:hypothetical protein